MSKEKTCPDFIKGATNVYRTKKYIVKQRIDIEVDMEDDKLTITDYKDGVIYLEKDEASYMFVAIGGDTLYDAQEKEFFYRRDGA